MGMFIESVDDYDLQEIARQVKNGNTSGVLDNEDGRTIYWDLNIEVEKED